MSRLIGLGGIKAAPSFGSLRRRSGGLPAGTLLAYDLFAGANGVEITTRPMDSGQSWTALYGTPIPKTDGSGRVQQGATGFTPSRALWNSGLTDIDIRVKIGVAALNNPWLVARASAEGNYIYALFDESAGWSFGKATAHSLAWIQNNGGVAPVANDEIRLLVKGSNFKLYQNATLRAEITSSDYAANVHHGLFLYNSTTARMLEAYFYSA